MIPNILSKTIGKLKRATSNYESSFVHPFSLSVSLSGELDPTLHTRRARLLGTTG